MTKPVSKWMRWTLALAFVACCVGCDQATKRIATEVLSGRPPQSYCANLLRLEYALNPGGFLSLGANLGPQLRFWLFAVLNLVLLAGATYLLVARWNMHWIKFAAVALLLAGGLGNQIDRLLHGGLVTDFLNVGVGPVRTGIFNFADMALTAGVLVLVITCWGAPDTSRKPAR